MSKHYSFSNDAYLLRQYFNNHGSSWLASSRSLCVGHPDHRFSWYVPTPPFLVSLWLTPLEALSLTGCVSTSPAIPNIYIVSLRSSANTTGIPLQVRIGYFGKLPHPSSSPTHTNPSSQESAASTQTAPAASPQPATRPTPSPPPSSLPHQAPTPPPPRTPPPPPPKPPTSSPPPWPSSPAPSSLSSPQQASSSSSAWSPSCS